MKQLKKVLLPLLSLLFLLILWITFSKPYLADNLVPIQTRQLVSFFPPWNSNLDYAGPVQNNAMPDVFTQLYPWKHFSIEQLKSGHMPYWNPNNFSGNPHIANYQTAIFSPFTLLYFALPFVDAWSISILLQPLIAGVGMYLFLKKLGGSQVSVAIGSVSFMFCGFMVVWMAYGTLSMSIAFLPWALYAIERYFQRKDVLSFLILSASIAVSFFSGHFQTSLYLLLFVICYLLYRVWEDKDYKKGIIVFLSLVVGLLVSSIQIIPTIVFYLESFRSQSIVTDQGIPFSYFVTLFAPDVFGNPVTRNDWVGFYAERAGFIGIIPFVLAWFAFFKRKNKRVLFFIGAALVSFLLALDSPLQLLLRLSHIPILATSIPTRIVVLLSFSLSVLSMFGYEVVMDFIKKHATKKLLLGLIPSVLVCLLSLIFLAIIPVIPADKAAIALRNLFLPFVFFAVLIAFGIVSYLRPQKTVLLVFGLILLFLTSFDSFRFATKWMPFDSESLLYPDNPVIKAMQELQGEGRVFGSFGPETQTYYGIQTIGGYDPLYIQRYGEFIKAAETGRYKSPDRSAVVLERKGPNTDRVLDILSVGLYFQPKSHINQSWAYPLWEKGYTKVYEDDYNELYKNSKVLPRFVLYHDYEVITDKAKRIQRFYGKDFPYKKTLLLEKEPKIAMKGASGSGTIKTVLISPNEIVLDIEASTPSLLFTSEPYYPSWKAEVNGKTTEILVADHAFRAVEVPKGISRVRFWYSYLF